MCCLNSVIQGAYIHYTASDGVGPTGTFITIDYVLEHIEKEHVVDIPGVVESIRQQRMNMVDTLVCTAFPFLLSTSCSVCMHICTIAMVLQGNLHRLHHLHCATEVRMQAYISI